MTDRRPTRRVTQVVLMMPRRSMVLVAVAVLLVVTLGAFMVSGALARATTAVTIADRPALLAQQAAAERDIERGYETAVEQIRKARALKLSISVSQADAIAAKAQADVRTLRRSAFISLGQVLGQTAADSEGYAASIEQRFDATPNGTSANQAAVLLAPRLYAIVLRLDDVAAQLTDKAIRDLTAESAPVTAPPTSSPPRATPTPTR